MTAPGRNAPCPCGSGKKLKRCCDGPEAHAARVAAREAERRREREAYEERMRNYRRRPATLTQATAMALMLAGGRFRP